MARPRKEDARDLRAAAVAATIDLLATKDVRDLTLAAVAAAAGCRPPALYGHFRDKTDLLRAAHDAGFERLYADKLAVAAAAARDGDALARLRAGGRAYVRFALENPGLYRLMFDPPPASGLPDNPFETDVGLRALGLLRAGLVAAQREGWLADGDPDVLAFTLWSSVHGAVALLLQGRAPAPAPDADPVAAADAVVDAMMAFIHGTRSPTSGDRHA